MAKLYISEYNSVGFQTGWTLPLSAALEPSTADQVVDFTAGEAKSATFDPTTVLVRVWSDADCCVLFGTSPTATTSKKPLAAKAPEYFGVRAGQKVSVITL